MASNFRRQIEWSICRFALPTCSADTRITYFQGERSLMSSRIHGSPEFNQESGRDVKWKEVVTTAVRVNLSIRSLGISNSQYDRTYSIWIKSATLFSDNTRSPTTSVGLQSGSKARGGREGGRYKRIAKTRRKQRHVAVTKATVIYECPGTPLVRPALAR